MTTIRDGYDVQSLLPKVLAGLRRAGITVPSHAPCDPQLDPDGSCMWGWGDDVTWTTLTIDRFDTDTGPGWLAMLSRYIAYEMPERFLPHCEDGPNWINIGSNTSVMETEWHLWGVPASEADLARLAECTEDQRSFVEERALDGSIAFNRWSLAFDVAEYLCPPAS